MTAVEHPVMNPYSVFPKIGDNLFKHCSSLFSGKNMGNIPCPARVGYKVFYPPPHFFAPTAIYVLYIPFFCTQ
jgi:hypothetical protein